MDLAVPLLTLIIGAGLGSAGTYFVGRKQRSDERKDELRAVSRLLYKELAEVLQILYAERVYPGEFVAPMHSAQRSKLDLTTWAQLRPQFAALLSEEDFARLEDLYSSLAFVGDYPVRREWSDNGDSPAEGVVGEYREDHIDDWVGEAAAALRRVGAWAGYGAEKIGEATAVPPLAPHTPLVPPEVDFDDLKRRLARLRPALEPWMVDQISVDILSHCATGDPTGARAEIEARLAKFGFRDADDPVYTTDDGDIVERVAPDAIEAVWSWVQLNFDQEHEDEPPA